MDALCFIPISRKKDKSKFYSRGEKLKLFLNYFNMIKHKTEDEMKNTITYIRKGLRAYFDFSTINSGMYPVIPRTGSLENEKGRIVNLLFKPRPFLLMLIQVVVY